MKNLQLRRAARTPARRRGIRASAFSCHHYSSGSREALDVIGAEFSLVSYGEHRPSLSDRNPGPRPSQTLGSFCNKRHPARSGRHPRGPCSRPYRTDSKDIRGSACALPERRLKHHYDRARSGEGCWELEIKNPRDRSKSETSVFLKPSVSVITPKTIDSEAWAKPYYILGADWTAQHKQKDFRVFFCEDNRVNDANGFNE